jgi:hypothetical protein
MLVAEKGIDCDLQETGSFGAAYRPTHYKNLEVYNHKLKDIFNHTIRLVPPERTQEKPPYPKSLQSFLAWWVL